MSKIYKNGIGLTITLDCGQDISTLTLAEINVQKPDNTEVTWTASLSGTNYISYVTVSEDDLDQVGRWKLQSYIETPDYSGLGETTFLDIYESFN